MILYNVKVKLNQTGIIGTLKIPLILKVPFTHDMLQSLTKYVEMIEQKCMTPYKLLNI